MNPRRKELAEEVGQQALRWQQLGEERTSTMRGCGRLLLRTLHGGICWMLLATLLGKFAQSRPALAAVKEELSAEVGKRRI